MYACINNEHMYIKVYVKSNGFNLAEY
jgi:hypothetical protein